MESQSLLKLIQDKIVASQAINPDELAKISRTSKLPKSAVLQGTPRHKSVSKKQNSNSQVLMGSVSAMSRKSVNLEGSHKKQLNFAQNSHTNSSIKKQPPNLKRGLQESLMKKVQRKNMEKSLRTSRGNTSGVFCSKRKRNSKSPTSN